MLVIVDYGMGNLASIANMFARVGEKAVITADPGRIADATKVVLPGVGAYDTAMRRIADQNLRPVLDHKALVERRPILGICLGMQLLMDASDEGILPGLGWLPGRAHSFAEVPAFGEKVPHMGWNDVRVERDCPVIGAIGSDPRFYFVHSYFVRCTDRSHAILRARYGIEFDAAVRRENIFGVQFHPEKSHRFGMRLFENFIRLAA